MERIICYLDHPDDKTFVHCLRQERMARNIFMTSSANDFTDQILCTNVSSFNFCLPWFNHIAKDFFMILKPKEEFIFKKFLCNETNESDVQIYCFTGKSCAKHHLRSSWLFNNRIDCVSYEMRCFCIHFPSIETVLEVHTSRKELFRQHNFMNYSVWLQARFVSHFEKTKEKLETKFALNMSLNQMLIGLLNSDIQHGRLQLVCGRTT